MTKIIGIGNAIVDILCKVKDQFLVDNGFIKGAMSLIDESTAQKLSGLKSEKITSGGSAGNTIATLGQLGIPTDFIGKVSNDRFGQKFISEIERTGAKFLNQNHSPKQSACSFVLVSDDAQRTMATFLGCASEITEDDITENAFKTSSILYLEGYLWDANTTTAALKKAINLAKKNSVKIAFTLSDVFCVSRHRQDFLSLIANDLDILFANQAEISELTLESEISPKNLADFFSQNKNLTSIITRSEKGCVVFEGGKILELPAEKNVKLLDTTGAGDAFAAGFLYGVAKGFGLEKSGQIGNYIASKIIQKFGARFEENEINL